MTHQTPSLEKYWKLFQATLRDLINDTMSCDSLTIGGEAFQSLLAKNEKDRCIYSRLKGDRFSLVLSPCKLFSMALKVKIH